jgi:hypothetical protein
MKIVYPPNQLEQVNSFVTAAKAEITRVIASPSTETSLLRRLENLVRGYSGLSIGVWESPTHGSIVWMRIRYTLPVFVPLCVVLESSCVAIRQDAYRALILDLTNALLQKEGFE